MIKEIPILFSTPMVQALLEGRKTQTRRLVKWPRVPDWHDWDYEPDSVERRGDGPWWPMWHHRRGSKDIKGPVKCPYGQVGDILWVRESWQWIEGFAGSGYYVFKTDFHQRYDGWERDTKSHIERVERWRPSIHMPKEAARIWLQVTDVRVERLQSITIADAKAEGVERYHETDAYVNFLDGTWTANAWASFGSLWSKINGRESWDANPFVWVVKFSVLSTTGKPDLNNL